MQDGQAPTVLPGASPRWRVALVEWFVAVMAPVAVAGALLVVAPDLSTAARALVFGAGLAFSLAMGGWATWQLFSTWRILTDLHAALREGDLGIRGSVPSKHNPLRGMVVDVNTLADVLREGRRKRTEALRFLAKTLTTLDNPIFVVDRERRLTVINPAARHLIDAEHDTVIGRDIGDLGLADVLATVDNAILTWDFPAKSGRWIVRRAIWYSEGQENTLVMLHDISVALGEEERRAWQRLIRVLSHELNNSLTPIGSLAGSLSTLIDGEGIQEVEGEVREGLEAIGRRAESLARFLSGYGRLAHLPPMHPQAFRLDVALARLARLEHRMPVTAAGTGEAIIVGDEGQLDQAFINLLRNAVESALPHGGAVRLDWVVARGQVRVTIEDEGGGLPERSALFVPFFTTKVDGSGIGLSLTRLIVEAHGGSVDLRARDSGRGALAIVVLPAGTA
jgi:two-component system, NtrC family, nitrogen regulation sensor histidine kinase NtrY